MLFPRLFLNLSFSTSRHTSDLIQRVDDSLKLFAFDLQTIAVDEHPAGTEVFLGQPAQLVFTDAEVFGPFAGIIGKVRDLYRVNVLVKSTQINIFKTALWQSPYRDMKNVYFDVDPFNVL